MKKIWSQSRYGSAINMVDPVASEVDFHEMCMTLAFINRFTGCSSISVAFHTLMVHDLIEPEYRVHALLHDMHEARIGDIATPVAQALAECAEYEKGERGAEAVTLGLRHLKFRHDTAIYEAAGLEMPNQDVRAAIRRADMRAMMTERRDFLAPPPEPWGDECEAAELSPRVYLSFDFGLSPQSVGQTLFSRLLPYLPYGERELLVA